MVCCAKINCKTAVQKIRNTPHEKSYDIILIDSRIAGIVTRDMTQLLLTKKLFSNTTVITVVQSGQEEAGIRLGYEDGFINKPIKWNKLYTKLQLAVDKKQKNSEKEKSSSTDRNSMPAAFTSQKINHAEIVSSLERLSELIDENNIKAKKQLEYINKTTGGLGVSDIVNHLADQVSRFDFKSARGTLNHLTKTLNHSLKERDI